MVGWTSVKQLRWDRLMGNWALVKVKKRTESVGRWWTTTANVSVK